MDNLKEFLIEAKKQTYANASAEKISSSRLNSKDYEYKKGNMIYHDTYFGGTNFIGEEAVYIDNKIYWAMNYYGITLDETLGEEDLTELGIKQAEELKDKIKNIDFDIIISSPLIRAKHTASIINRNNKEIIVEDNIL